MNHQRVGPRQPHPHAGEEEHERVHRETDSAANPANARLAKAMIGPRRNRSASQPIGVAPRTRNADEAVMMKTMVPLLTPSELRMSGARVPRAADSSSSSALIAVSTAIVYVPPMRSASLKVGVLADTGQIVDGDGRLRSGVGLTLRLEVEDGPGKARRLRLKVGHGDGPGSQIPLAERPVRTVGEATSNLYR